MLSMKPGISWGDDDIDTKYFCLFQVIVKIMVEYASMCMKSHALLGRVANASTAAEQSEFEHDLLFSKYKGYTFNLVYCIS